MIRYFVLVIFLTIPKIFFSQEIDVNFYDLTLDVDIERKYISGNNIIHFHSKDLNDSVRIDLSNQLFVDSVLFLNQKCEYIHDNDIITVYLNKDLKKNNNYILNVFYRGKPTIAERPPWNGGFVWDMDNNGDPWVGVACQGDGASIWWPNHDNLSDEPDSIRLSITVPKGLKAVSNGNLILKSDTIIDKKEKSTFVWKTSNPINNYNVTINIAKYKNFSDTLNGHLGLLHLDYYVLHQDYINAKSHFSQVNEMLHFFEDKFGPYPFYEDGYCLVQTPYLGMEHQSCIAYGNKFKKGYLGNYPGNIDFDFIIIHETAHEWWGNSVSMGNIADMWIHESFATYSEALYVEEVYSYNDMITYLNYQKNKILNDVPIKSEKFSSTDMYYKGSWILHTLRSCFNNDSLFFDLIKGIQLEFKHEIVDTYDIVKYIEAYYGDDLTVFFQQYLFKAELPVFEYFITKRNKKKYLNFRWDALLGFEMPLLVKINELDFDWIYPTEKWKEIELVNIKEKDFKIENDLFLININKIK